MRALAAPLQHRPDGDLELTVCTPHASGSLSALHHDGEIFLSAAALAHLAVEARGAWRVRRGLGGWQQAGPDGEWMDMDRLHRAEVVWFRPATGWQLGPVDPEGRRRTVRPMTLVVTAPTGRSRTTRPGPPDQRRPA